MTNVTWHGQPLLDDEAERKAARATLGKPDSIDEIMTGVNPMHFFAADKETDEKGLDLYSLVLSSSVRFYGIKAVKEALARHAEELLSHSRKAQEQGALAKYQRGEPVKIALPGYDGFLQLQKQ